MVVDKTKTTFIKGRSILDGSLIVNEVIVWTKHKKKKLMIFKVDFEKAFNDLNWNFLDDMLKQMDFGRKWWTRVKGSTSTTGWIQKLDKGSR